MEKFSLRYLKPSAFIFICAILVLALYAAKDYWGLQFSVFSSIIGIFGLINQYAWNVRPFSWMYSVPDFSGRYKGELTYEFRNEKCELISDSLEHIKVVCQNGSDIVIKSWTKKKDGQTSSMSTSIEASIVKDKDGSYSLIYNYLNDGNPQLGFPPHYGTEVIRFVKNGKRKHLVGRYYTERHPFQTKGTIDLLHTSNDLSHEK